MSKIFVLEGSRLKHISKKHRVTTIQICASLNLKFNSIYGKEMKFRPFIYSHFTQ